MFTDRSPSQTESVPMQDIPNLMTFTQDQKKSALLAIEEGLGSIIEDDLAQRARDLPATDIDELATSYMQLSSVRKFLVRAKTKFPELDAGTFTEILKKYFESQINFAQSVTLERDLLTVSQYIRQYFGLDQSIYLLENIGNADFDLTKFVTDNIQQQSAIQEENKQAATVPNAQIKPTIFDNLIKFQKIQSIISRIKNVYIHAEIKQIFYSETELQQEKSYKNLQESLMWINGQRLACVTGMKNIRENRVGTIAVAVEDSLVTASSLQGARAHLQNTIGMFVDDELQNLAHVLADTPVENVIRSIKAKDTYAQLIRALNNGTRAGFNTYLPHTSSESLVRLIEEYLHVNVHLAQSIMHEKNIVKISQYLRQYYSVDVSKKLLTDLEKPSFDLNKFFARMNQPSDEIKVLIENIHHFYVYAAIKKQDNFFDSEDPQAKKLFESEMWLGLQRRCCIEGMSLIQTGEVYQNKQITFGNMSQAVEVVREEEKKSQAQLQPVNKRIRAEVTTSSSSSSSIAVPVFNWATIQNELSDEEALAVALQVSQLPSSRPVSSLDINGVVDEEAAVNEALRRSRVEANAQPPLQQQNRITDEKRDHQNKTELMLAASQGDLAKVIDLTRRGANIQLTGRQGYKSIHYAAENNHIEVMGYLISLGASITEPVAYGQTAMSMARLNFKFVEAAARGDETELRRLITTFKIPVDVRGANNQTALMAAAAAGKLSTVKFLVEEHQASMDAVGQYNYKTLHFAADNNHLDVMAYLISKNASPIEVSQYGQSAHALARLGHKLVDAAKQANNLAQLRYYLDALKVPVDMRGTNNQTALMAAAAVGDLATVKFLVEERGANLHSIGQYNYTALHYAADANQLDVMAYLISKGLSPLAPTQYGQSAHVLARLNVKLVDAARSGDIANLKYYLDILKVPLESRGANNQTALMAAAGAGQRDTVIFLVEERHADINATGQYQYKAAHHAADNNHEGIVAYFIRRQETLATDVTQYNQTINSLLHLNAKFMTAAASGNIAELKRLKDDFKVSANAVRGQQNKTALMAAAEAGRADVVEFLIETCEVPVDAVDTYSKRAIHYAGKNTAIVDYLVRHHATPLPVVAHQEEKAQPVTYQPVTQASSSPAPEVSGTAVLADARKILEALQRKTDLMKDEKDDASAPYWGTSDENDAKYHRNHAAEYTLQESALSQERFYAATTLLASALSRVRGNNHSNNPLEIELREGTDRVIITAKHNPRVVQQLYDEPFAEKNLPAPIGKFPFDPMRRALQEILSACFVNWQVSSSDNLLTQQFRSSNDMYQVLTWLYTIEKACQELDRNFALNFRTSNRHDEDTNQISVDKAKLDQAKAILGYSVATHYAQSLSAAQLLSVSSSIVNRRDSSDSIAAPVDATRAFSI